MAKRKVGQGHVDKSRRSLLKISVAGLSLAVPAIYAVKGLLRDKWAFLDAPQSADINLNWTEAERLYVPIGPERPFRSESGHKEFGLEVVSEISKTDPSGHYTAALTEQLYGVPEEPVHAQDLLEYCKIAVDFLHTRLRGLDKHSPQWTIIKHGDAFERQFSQMVFLGDSYFYIQRGHAKNNTMPERGFIVGRCMPAQSGAATEINYKNSDNSLESWYTFISTGNYAVLSPISEFIHLTTSRRLGEYREQISNDDRVQIDETVAESLSHLVCVELVKWVGIPNGMGRLRHIRENFPQTKSYHFVGSAIRFAEQNGIQNSFDLYMENPLKYIERVKQY